MFAFPSVGAWELWHSKADKIVNNFHGQNQFQFHGQIPIFFMVKTLIFVVKTDFLMFRPTNFLVRSQNILVTKFLGQSPFHSNAKISCSTLFHSNFMLNSVPFQQNFMVSHDFIVSDSLDEVLINLVLIRSFFDAQLTCSMIVQKLKIIAGPDL